MKKIYKILLINAYSGGYRTLPPFSFSLGLLSIATLLKKYGYEVKIYNSYEFLENYKEILNEDLLYIGISVMTPQIPMALKITRLIKNLKPNINIVWGGVQPTLFPEQTINNRLIDVVVIGEGEYTCLELAKCLSNHSNILQVNGICYKFNGNIFKTEGRPISDINKEPFLNYDIIDVSKTIYHDFSSWGGPKNVRTLGIITGRGCPYQCTFCINSAILERKYRFKNASNILNELEFLINKYEIECVRFQDEEFFISKKRVFEFLDGIEKRNIKIYWTADVRANHFIENYITTELADRLKSSGCFYWTIGVESASERVLKKIKKNITLKQVLRASDVSRKAGIKIGYGFMIGIPGETKKDITDSVKFAYKLKNKNTNELIFSIFRPYPGSKLYAEAVNLGLKEAKTLEEWEKHDFYETGFQDIDSYPWIEDKVFIKFIKFTTNNVFSNYKRMYEWLMWKDILKLIGIIRIKLNFWKMPAEYVLFNFVRKLIKGNKNKSNNIII
jgi:radical SAM superfamily enzyme YgiQ (UPF0313 family)